MMEQQKPKYFIVKYMENDVPKCAVVPESWVTHRRNVDNKGVIALPTDNASTEARVRNNETPATDWREVLCEILYYTEDYSAAKIYTMEQNEAARRETSVPNRGGPKTQKRQAERPSETPNTKLTKLNEETHTQQSKTKALPNKDRKEIFHEELRALFSEMIHLVYEYIGLYEEEAPVKMFGGTNNTEGSTNKENGARWTLRHPQPGRGLVELVENSNVYVEKRKLEQYTSSAETGRHLVQTLLPLIFTDEALSSCTLRLKKNKLDGNAVRVLLDYAERVARRKGWDVDEHYLKHCITKQLGDMRSKSISRC